MSSNPNPATQKPNIFAALVNRIRLVFRLLGDSRVPIYLKFLPFLSIVYLVMPFDFIPDMAPLLGQVDDLGVLLLSIEAFIMLSPQDVVQEHLAALESKGNPSAKGDVIDGEWHTVNHD
jgi:uncharacterized membrane protein YkvA (DUF1232 family)